LLAVEQRGEAFVEDTGGGYLTGTVLPVVAGTLRGLFVISGGGVVGVFESVGLAVAEARHDRFRIPTQPLTQEVEAPQCPGQGRCRAAGPEHGDLVKPIGGNKLSHPGDEVEFDVGSADDGGSGVESCLGTPRRILVAANLFGHLWVEHGGPAGSCGSGHCCPPLTPDVVTRLFAT